MRVLITGGAGHIGKATAERFLNKGWDVRLIGLEANAPIDGVENYQVNVLNYEDVLKHMRGCAAVVHLAAIRTPLMAPAPEVYQVNTVGTFNVFEAAAALGIKRVVQASSINALGSYYGVADRQFDYLPMDEEHRVYTTDSYSFSKEVSEHIGAYYWRRDGISSVGLRWPGVYVADYFESEGFQERRKKARDLLDELANLPENEALARIAEARVRSYEFRSKRPFDFLPENEKPPYPEDMLVRMYLGDRFNFFTLVDVRDAAQSIEKGLTADYEGDHALFINDSHNVYGYESRILARLFYPEVTQFKSDLSGSATLLSIDKARALIGYEPEYSISKTEHSA